MDDPFQRYYLPKSVVTSARPLCWNLACTFMRTCTCSCTFLFAPVRYSPTTASYWLKKVLHLPQPCSQPALRASQPCIQPASRVTTITRRNVQFHQRPGRPPLPPAFPAWQGSGPFAPTGAPGGLATLGCPPLERCIYLAGQLFWPGSSPLKRCGRVTINIISLY